jgi:hypothetical protein
VDAHLRWLLNWNGCRFQRDSLPPHRPASPAKGRGVTIRRSLGITAATRVVVVALSFATVVIVSRLLTPEEIGIFSVTVALVGLGHVFRDFGVAHYLIQTPEVTVQRKRAAFTVTLALSWTVALLLVLLKPAAVHFYDDQRVGQVLLLLVVNFLILPFGAPLRTLLQRDMQFKKLAVVNLSNHFVQSLTTVAAAWAGASYMSMAWGSIAGNLANAEGCARLAYPAWDRRGAQFRCKSKHGLVCHRRWRRCTRFDLGAHFGLCRRRVLQPGQGSDRHGAGPTHVCCE